MSTLHAKIWIRKYNNVQLPVEPFALVEMRLDDKGEYYKPFKVNLLYAGEYKFRLAQINKAYDRVRSIPYIIAAVVSDDNDCRDYDILERLPETRIWKCMVKWSDVIDAVEYECEQKWPVKTAGYDGPFTAG